MRHWQARGFPKPQLKYADFTATHMMKTPASKINQASFLLKTTEVSTRLLLAGSVVIQEVVHQKCVSPALSPPAQSSQEAPCSLQKRGRIWDGTQPPSAQPARARCSQRKCPHPLQDLLLHNGGVDISIFSEDDKDTLSKHSGWQRPLTALKCRCVTETTTAHPCC